MLAATKVKMSGSEKQSEQEHKHSLHKACNLEVKVARLDFFGGIPPKFKH